MEMIKFVLFIMFVLIINAIVIRIWMIIANAVGEFLGFSRFIDWVISKFKAYFS